MRALAPKTSGATSLDPAGAASSEALIAPAALITAVPADELGLDRSPVLQTTAEADRAVQTSEPQERWWLPLLGAGAPPLFLLGDLVACAAAAVSNSTALPVAGTFAVVLVVAQAASGLYRSRLALSVLDDLPRLTKAWLVSAALLVVATAAIGALNPPLGFLAATFGSILGLRLLTYGSVRWLRSRGTVAHRTIVVGAGETGREIFEKVRATPSCGLAPLGFVDLGETGVRTLPAPLLGDLDELGAVLDRHRPGIVIIANDQLPEAVLVPMIRACHRHRCELLVLPRLHQVTHVGDDMDFIGDLPLVRLRRAAYRTWAWRAKRLLDVVVSGVALLVLGPVLLACAAAVYLEGGRGVIFRQERVGVDGRRFQLLKFRSLRPVDDHESATNWSIAVDDRLGPVGRILRTTSLDELPQLINILRGEMSLVGPRPERPHFVAEFDRLYGGYSARHRVPCGLTGWAQVHGLRGDTSISRRASFDNFYIENWSFWLDLKIILRTVSSVFTAPGA